MWKAVIVMFFGTVVASIGDGLLSKGLRELQQMEWSGSFWPVCIQYVSAAIHKPSILLGIACQAIFFGVLLVAFSWADLSLVLPITAFTYVFAPLIAQFYLREQVNTLRWVGAIVIVLGVAAVLLGERGGASLAKESAYTSQLRADSKMNSHF